MAPTLLERTATVRPCETGYGTFTSSEDLLSEFIESDQSSPYENEKDEECGIRRAGGDSSSRSHAEPTAKASCIYKYGGMALAFLASMLISGTTLIVKVLYTNYGTHVEDASFARWAGITLPTIPVLIYCEWCTPESKERSVFDTVWPVNENWKTVLGLLLRGFLGCSTVILRYSALHYLTMGDTSVISYSSPILVTILAHFLLREKTGVLPVLLALITLCGVVIITRPPILTRANSFDYATLPGVGFACGALVSSALMTLLTRKLRHVQFSVTLLMIGSIGMLQSYFLAVVHGPGLSLPKCWPECVLLLGISALSFMGQMAIVLALKVEQAGPVALVRSCDVIFSFLSQYIFLGVTPDVFSAIGGSIIFCGILLMGMRKYVSSVSPDHRLRKTFGILLY